MLHSPPLFSFLLFVLLSYMSGARIYSRAPVAEALAAGATTVADLATGPEQINRNGRGRMCILIAA